MAATVYGGPARCSTSSLARFDGFGKICSSFRRRRKVAAVQQNSRSVSSAGDGWSAACDVPQFFIARQQPPWPRRRYAVAAAWRSRLPTIAVVTPPQAGLKPFLCRLAVVESPRRLGMVVHASAEAGGWQRRPIGVIASVSAGNPAAHEAAPAEKHESVTSFRGRRPQNGGRTAAAVQFFLAVPGRLVSMGTTPQLTSSQTIRRTFQPVSDGAHPEPKLPN